MLNEVLAAQSPSIPLNAAQKQQMQNEGLTAVDTGSWVQALQLDVHRRYSDVNWAAQLQSMTPAAVEREIANELAVTNYLLLENYRMAMKNASVNATTLAAVANATFRPSSPPSSCRLRTSPTDRPMLSITRIPSPFLCSTRLEFHADRTREFLPQARSDLCF